MKLYMAYLSAVVSMLTRLPDRARKPLVQHIQIFEDFLRYGGPEGLSEEARQWGVRGKWVAPSPDEADSLELSRRLAAAYQAMKAEQQSMPSAYVPHPIWRDLLEADWSVGRAAVQNNDIAGFDAFLRNFFRNGGISGVWGSGDMIGEFSRLQGWSDWTRLSTFLKQYKTWRTEMPGATLDQIDHPRVGNPWGYDIDGALVIEPEFEYHELAHRFQRILTGVENPVVVEIGGGFGGFATQLLKVVPNVRYIGFDLPENVIIQSYNLSRCFPEHEVAFNDIGAVDRAKVTLLPNFALREARPSKVSIVSNVRSFAEMSSETLAAYFERIDAMDPEWIYHENVTGSRKDGTHGISATEYPPLDRYALINSVESRWPRYDRNSAYPCREYLFHRIPT